MCIRDSAASVAAVMFNKFDLKGKRVVCIVSGGNIDVTSLSRVIDRGLMNSGRSASLLIELIDKPGQLKEISSIIADCGDNVTGVPSTIGECLPRTYITSSLLRGRVFFNFPSS